MQVQIEPDEVWRDGRFIHAVWHGEPTPDAVFFGFFTYEATAGGPTSVTWTHQHP